MGLRQFRVCSPSGGVIATTQEQKGWGGLEEGVTVNVGPKTPGAGRKTHVGRPLPSPRSHPGLWERKAVEGKAPVPLSSTLTGPTAGSLRRVSCSGPCVALVTLHPGARLESPVSGPREGGAASGAAGGRSITSGGAPALLSPAGVAEAAGDPVQRPRGSIQIQPPNPLRAGTDPRSGHRLQGRQQPAFLGIRWRSWHPCQGSWMWHGGQ